MTCNEFVDRIETDMASILLKGFTTKETDSAMLFRLMAAQMALLRGKAAILFDELFAQRKAVTNGETKQCISPPSGRNGHANGVCAANGQGKEVAPKAGPRIADHGAA